MKKCMLFTVAVIGLGACQKEYSGTGSIRSAITSPVVSVRQQPDSIIFTDYPPGFYQEWWAKTLSSFFGFPEPLPAVDRWIVKRDLDSAVFLRRSATMGSFTSRDTIAWYSFPLRDYWGSDTLVTGVICQYMSKTYYTGVIGEGDLSLSRAYFADTAKHPLKVIGSISGMFGHGEMNFIIPKLH